MRLFLIGLSLAFINSINAQIIETKLTASDGSANDRFGRSVSLSYNYAIIGTPQWDDSVANYGSAYIFYSDSTGWSEQAILTASDGAAGDQFGKSVSISGDYTIVGADYDDDNGDNSGSAYVFLRNGTNWIEQAKLTASDGTASRYFGQSVSIDGDYVIVGAYESSGGNGPGSAYIFYNDSMGWSEQAILTASDGSLENWFGLTVCISDDYAIVGAKHDDENGWKSGSAYIFMRTGTNWIEQAKLTASDGAIDDQFGQSVSISGDYAIVGARSDDDYGEHSGSAYIFMRNGTNWIEQAKLTASDGDEGDQFGISVSIIGDLALVGAWLDDNKGAAYIYKRNESSWTEQVKLIASDGAALDYFGYAVSISDDFSLVGARGDDDNGIYSGSVYIYEGFSPIDITVISPNGEETWQVGNQYDITWTSNNVTEINIEYSTNGGSIWLPVASSIPANLGSYTWTILNTPSNNCKVRIKDSADSTIFDVSDSVFTISSEPLPSITVISPNGGENWQGGMEEYITWISENVLNIEIEYSVNNGTTWLLVASSITANLGSYNWTVPNTPSNNCLVKIKDSSNPAIFDVSDNVFVISPQPISSITVITPNGGENWQVGTEENITWTIENIVSVDIKYSTNNGNIWIPIDSSIVANLGTYNWTIPNTPSDNCLIKISDSFNPTIFDVSDSVFTIKDQQQFFILRDYNHNPIPNKEFVIHIVNSDLTEELIGNYTTNAAGQILIESDFFAQGESIKFSRLVDTTYAVKHQDVENIAFYIQLDNGNFDDSSNIFYHSFNNQNEQYITLDHPSILFNLVVSVEWDATDYYLDSLIQGFRYASNLVYDATNGQLYINKVSIFDNGENWSEADVQIKAQNDLRPHSVYNKKESANINKRTGGGWWGASGHINMPRILYVTNNSAEQRRLSFSLYPYQWTLRHTYGSFYYLPSKAIAHEFLHYSIGLMDEYIDKKGNSVLGDYNFGLMDDKYGSSLKDFELSDRSDYSINANQITEQYILRNDRSCWGFFDWSFSDTYDDINTQIKVPDELMVGPNNDLENPNYDVGALMIENSPDPVNFQNGAFTYPVRIQRIYIPKEADVTLIKDNQIHPVSQGRSDPDGNIRVLGANIGDIIRISRYFPKVGHILFREIIIGGPDNISISNFKVQFEDTIIVNLNAVNGNIAIVNEINLNQINSLRYTILFSSERAEEPHLEFINNNDPVSFLYFSQTTNPSIYQTTLNGELNNSGLLTLFAKDDSLNTFFFTQEYAAYYPSSETNITRFLSSKGHCEVLLDSSNFPIEQLFLLTSGFKPLFNGLEPEAEYVGEMHTITGYPNVEGLKGVNSISIFYDENDLVTQPEEYLNVYIWGPEQQQWLDIGGIVDTIQNVVNAPINSLGTFALFTKNPITDSESNGIHPNEYSLEQNYPNPFNPLTKIKYSVPYFSNVNIKIFDILGNEIVTLVNENKRSGNYEVIWDAEKLPSGIYFYRLQAGNFIETKKMVLMK